MEGVSRSPNIPVSYRNHIKTVHSPIVLTNTVFMESKLEMPKDFLGPNP